MGFEEQTNRKMSAQSRVVAFASQETSVEEDTDPSENETNSSSEEDDGSKSDGSEERDSDEERTQIRGDLSTMSFEDLMKLKEELGTKVYDEAIFGKKSRPSVKKSKADFKRVNKNRPREMSSKRLVPFMRTDDNVKKQKSTAVRDPRFDEKCGDYDSKIFKNNYEFVNEIREKEIRKLKKNLRKSIEPEKQKEIKLMIQRLENQIREEKKRKIRQRIDKEEEEDIKKAREEGRRPWHRTPKERKITELVKQYEDLKNTGKLDKHLEKRRKKNATKDRKKFGPSE